MSPHPTSSNEPRNRHHRTSDKLSILPSESQSQPEAPNAPNATPFEFGGPLGVTALMLGFPLLMYYMFLGATVYHGHLPLPEKNQSLIAFLSHLTDQAITHAYPTKQAWAIYWTFLVLEGLAYLYLPGVQRQGKPLPHLNGARLTYHCSAIWSWYITILLALALHFSGVFRLPRLISEFGPLMSVAILSGFIVSAGLA